MNWSEFMQETVIVVWPYAVVLGAGIVVTLLVLGLLTPIFRLLKG